MTANRQKTLAMMALIFFLASCNVGTGSSSGAALAVRLQNAQSFNPRIEPGRIERFRVTISGEGIATPIMAEFPGDATEGVIDGVPVGEARTITAAAINGNEATIRAGETSGIEISGGMNDVPITMEAVPIFANLRDGAAVENTRLVFRIFSDPAHPVVVEDRGEVAPSVLADAATGVAEIALDRATGLGRCAPTMLTPGSHRFAVRDAVTGRATEIALLLTDGTKATPAPLAAASVPDAEAGW